MTTSIVVVDAAEVLEGSLRRALAGADVRVVRVTGAEPAFEALNREAADVVIAAGEPDDPSVLEWMRRLLDCWPGLPVVLCAPRVDLAAAIAAVRVGAFDVVAEPFEAEQLRFVVEKALTATRRRAAAAPPPLARSEIVFGPSAAMAKTQALLARVAPSASTVLVRGESGTGKELVARAIHELSPRAGAPFIKIDCAALPETLLESELFGYEKGAFTGASARKQGRVELAQGGTLFLDEIGELSLLTQAKLLRLLQDRVIERLGGTTTLEVDVRVIAATHRDLEGMVEERTFRQDLFYRLNVIPVWLAPLRARREDIAELAHRFSQDAAARSNIASKPLEPGALELLTLQRWPGNVRQLQNFVERLVVLAPGPAISRADVEAELAFPVRFETETGAAGADASAPGAEGDASVTALPEAMLRAERELLLRALKQAGGNRSAAARLLGVSRSTLYNKLEEHGLP